MKRFVILLLLLLAVFTPAVSAATPTPTPIKSELVASASGTQVPTKKVTVLDDLKDRLATKVAELRQSQKKALFGLVKAITISTLTMETKTSDVKIELTDTIKVFQTLKDKRTELTIDDVTKGDSVVIFGDYDTSLDLMKSKIIVIQNPVPERIHGTVSAIDTKEYTISVETSEKQTYVIDIEKYTTVSMYVKADGVTKSGFSKIAVGSTVFVSGKANAKIANRISADRILDIGNLSGITPTPSITSTPVATESAVPSSTKKVTPTPTVKK